MRKQTYSIMFHHFHDEIHQATQGSLDGCEFRSMIEWLNNNYSLIGAREYKEKFGKIFLRLMKYVYLLMTH